MFSNRQKLRNFRFYLRTKRKRTFCWGKKSSRLKLIIQTDSTLCTPLIDQKTDGSIKAGSLTKVKNFLKDQRAYIMIRHVCKLPADSWGWHNDPHLWSPANGQIRLSSKSQRTWIHRRPDLCLLNSKFNMLLIYFHSQINLSQTYRKALFLLDKSSNDTYAIVRIPCANSLALSKHIYSR